MNRPQSDLVDTLRREVRAMKFTPVDDTELARIRAIDAETIHNDAIEGLRQDPEVVALYRMLYEERAPVDVCHAIVQKYLSCIAR